MEVAVNTGGSANVGSKKNPRKNENRQPLSWLPILLGLFLLVLNIAAAARLWKFLPISKPQSAVPIVLLASSVFIGVFLIVYAIALRRSERHSTGIDAQVAPRSTTAGQTTSFARWVTVPLLVALPALLLTVWGAEVAQSGTPQPNAQKPCIELYQQAASIQRDNPTFRMPPQDRDEQRCNINRALRLQAAPPR